MKELLPHFRDIPTVSIETYDEILSPQRCERCGRVFTPQPDAFSFCPDCHACHIGLRVPSGLTGSRLARAWLRSFTGDDRIHMNTGYATHQTHGRYCIVRYGEASRTSAGFAALVERGESDMVSGPPYMILRLAGFCPNGVPSSLRAPLPNTTLGTKPWGLELVAREYALEAVQTRGPEAIFEELARIAEEAGYEPVFESSEADAAELPAEVSAALDAGQERSIRCARCGAPVSAQALGGGAPCPYCLAPINLPRELQHELEGYRRQLQFYLRGAELWNGLQAERDDIWLACAVCGAPCAHEPGVVDEACQSCGAMVVPSTQRLQSDAGSARDELLALTARRRAVARKQAEDAHRSARTALWLQLGFFVGSALLTAVMSIVPILFMVGSSNVEGALVFLFISASLPLTALGYGVYVVRRNARQRRQWQPVWAAIADQLDGVAPRSSRNWFARFWKAPLPFPSQLGPSRAAGVVEAVHDGVPLMIEGDLESKVGPLRQQGRAPSLQVYIAAEWPDRVGVLKATRGIRERRRQLQAAGFSSCLRRRGFELKASDEVLRRLKRHPEQTVAVVPVLFEALRIVELLGGRGTTAGQ